MICFFVKSSLLQSGFNKMYKPTDKPIQTKELDRRRVNKAQLAAF